MANVIPTKQSVMEALVTQANAMINAYGNEEVYDIFKQVTKGGMTTEEAITAMEKAGIQVYRTVDGSIITYDTNLTPPIDDIPNKTKLPVNADNSLKIGSAPDSTKTNNISGMGGSTANSTSSSYGTGSKVKVAVNGYNSSKVVDGVYEAQPAKMGVSRKFIDGVEVLDKPKVTLSSNMSSALSMAGSLANAGVLIGSAFYTAANLIGVDKVKEHLPDEANKFFFGDDTIPTITEAVIRGEATEEQTVEYLNYILEDNFVYNLKYGYDSGFYNTGGSGTGTYVDMSTTETPNAFDGELHFKTANSGYVIAVPSNISKTITINDSEGLAAFVGMGFSIMPIAKAPNYFGVLAMVSSKDETVTITIDNNGTITETRDTIRWVKYKEHTAYFYYTGIIQFDNAATKSDVINGDIPYYQFTSAFVLPDDFKSNATNSAGGNLSVCDYVAWLLTFGTIKGGGGTIIEGLNIIGDTPNWITPEDDLASIKTKYRSNYDWLYKNRIETDITQDNGTEKTFTYIPIPIPTGGEGEKPTTEGLTQGKTQDEWSVKPSDSTTPKVTLDTLLEQLSGIKPNPNPEPSGDYRGMAPSDTPLPNPPAPDPPPSTGGGDTPSVIIPVGAAEALWSIYNPTLIQVKQLGSWLWSSAFADQVLKILADPMQAIISCHKVFGTPSVNGTGNIKVGYLDSGISGVNIVDNQYTHVDCGSVNMYEYFGNVFDYTPYTDIQIYLPFIGIVPLRVEDVLRSTISVSYDIDVLTGTCLANINVLRDNAGGVLYTYNGNCAVQYPLSSGSYLGVVSTLLSIAGGFAVGGTAGGIVGGALSIMNSKGTDIKRSGNLSGNAGAMGIKKPYVIISRPITAMATDYQKYLGIPTNSTAKLSDCKGFVKCKEVFISSGTFAIDLKQNLTAEQANEIESLLKQGVIIN